MVWPMSWDDALIGRNVRSDSREGQWRCVAQCSTGAAIAASRTRSQGRTVPGERGQISALIIGNSVFPTTKYYANPFESQRSHRRVVVLALAALLLVVASCPLRVRDGVTRPSVKTLTQKLGTGPAEMDPFLFPAPLRHRRNPTVRLHFPGIAITLSLRAKRRKQARRYHCTRSRERLKNKKIRMRGRRLLDLLV